VYHHAIEVTFGDDVMLFQVNDFVYVLSEDEVPFVARIKDMWEDKGTSKPQASVSGAAALNQLTCTRACAHGVPGLHGAMAVSPSGRRPVHQAAL